MRNISRIIIAAIKKAPFKNQKGVALILTVWSLALLMIMASQFAFSMRTEVKITANYKQEVQCYYIAYAGIQAALAEMIKPYTKNALNGDKLVFIRPYSDYETNRNEGREEEEGLPCTPQRENVPLGPGFFSYYITDEDGKFNVNSLISRRSNRNESSIEKFRELLVASGVEDGIEADTIIDSIADWMDDDDMHHANGAEQDWYDKNYEEKGFGFPYKCKNGKLDTLEELILIRGITPEILYGSERASNMFLTGGPKNDTGYDDDEAGFTGIIQYLTVYSFKRNYKSINKDTASLFLLNVLFPEEFEDIAESRESQAEGEDVSGRGRRSRTFTIQSTGWLKNSPVSRTIKAVVDNFGSSRVSSSRNGRIRVRFWKDNAEFLEPGETLTLDYFKDTKIFSYD